MGNGNVLLCCLRCCDGGPCTKCFKPLYNQICGRHWNFFPSVSRVIRAEPRIKRLTPLCCCGFIPLLIPTDLGDHWGRIVHHIQVWSRVLTSHFKLRPLSLTRRRIKPTLTQEETQPMHSGKRRNKTPTRPPFLSDCRRSLNSKVRKVTEHW